MKHSKLILAHILGTIIAFLTIITFFSFSLVAEIIGDHQLIKIVKTNILYLLPILIIVMPMLVVSGKKLAGKSRSPLVLKKLKRMKFITANGIILISLAIYLYIHANYKTINTSFLIAQITELLFGFTNLTLIGLNIKTGLKLSGKL